MHLWWVSWCGTVLLPTFPLSLSAPLQILGYGRWRRAVSHLHIPKYPDSDSTQLRAEHLCTTTGNVAGAIKEFHFVSRFLLGGMSSFWLLLLSLPLRHSCLALFAYSVIVQLLSLCDGWRWAGSSLIFKSNPALTYSNFVNFISFQARFLLTVKPALSEPPKDALFWHLLTAVKVRLVKDPSFLILKHH